MIDAVLCFALLLGEFTCNESEMMLTFYTYETSDFSCCQLRCHHSAETVCKHPTSSCFLFLQEVRWATSAAAFDKVEKTNIKITNTINLCSRFSQQFWLCEFTFQVKVVTDYNSLDVEIICAAVSLLCYMMCLTIPGRLWGVTWREKMTKQSSYYTQRLHKSPTATRKGLCATVWSGTPLRIWMCNSKANLSNTMYVFLIPFCCNLGFSALRRVCICWAVAGKRSSRTWRRKAAQSKRLSHVPLLGLATVSRRCSSWIWRERWV